MFCIGLYYTDYGAYLLYRVDQRKEDWVSNICYFDSNNLKYYSPNLRNIAQYGRDHDGLAHEEWYWSSYISDTYPSFVSKYRFS
jgi:hypothetical protein